MTPIAAVTPKPPEPHPVILPAPVGSPVVLPPAPDGPAADLLIWQRHLLPFMTAFIILMAIAFFVFSGLHVYQVTHYIQAEQSPSTRQLIQGQVALSQPPPGQTALTPDQSTRNAILLLEVDALDRRYHQAGGLLMSRIWSRQLAFITGMVLAFVGSIFILGKLSESTSNLSGGSGEWKVAISSASPGIILAFFGTVLLVASLFTKASLDVNDAPVYLNLLAQPATPAPVPAPGPSIPSLDDLKRLAPKPSPRPAR